eukprot:403348473
MFFKAFLGKIVILLGLFVLFEQVESKISFGCTLSCSLWNICRVINIRDLTRCGPEPARCICTHFMQEDNQEVASQEDQEVATQEDNSNAKHDSNEWCCCWQEGCCLSPCKSGAECGFCFD